MDVSSNHLPTVNYNFAAFDKPFHASHVYSNFDYYVKETIFERRLRTCGDRCRFFKCQCIDVIAALLLVHLGLPVSVPAWWRAHRCSRLLLVLISIVLACFLKSKTSRQASEIIFGNHNSEFSVCGIVFCISSTC